MPTLKVNDGLTLAYDMAGSGPPLLLISGLGYGGWFWHWVVPRLAERFRVITFDNRGAGGSDKPDGPYTTPMLAQDALGLLDGLGISATHVLGHSLGGFIAQELALARPGLAQRLILASTTFGGPNVIPITPEALQVMMDRSGDPVALVKRGLGLAAAPGFAERCPDTAQALLDYRLANPVPPAQYSAQVMAGAQHNAEARLGAIACPTLVLAGAEDRVVPPGNAERLAARLPNARVMILPGVGHIFPVEDPQTTARVVSEFLLEV